MAAATQAVGKEALRQPLKMGSRTFAESKYEIYAQMREEAPVCRVKMAGLEIYAVSRYQDCIDIVTDPRLARNRTTATGKSRFPIPLPRSVMAVALSMIVEDDPEHRRLRNMVNRSFRPSAIERVSGQVRDFSAGLLDSIEPRGKVDLLSDYCKPIPSAVIAQIVGVSESEMPSFQNTVRILSEGLSGWSVLRSIFWDLRKISRFMREVIDRKKSDPGEDILTYLLDEEEEGARLSDDELLAMLFLLIMAGFETTTHMIANGVLALLQHPDQLARLRAEPALIDSAVEEMLRFCGPVHGSKQAYATEDIVLHGVRIPKGAPVIPLWGAANHDPDAFEQPERFDIGRNPNHHLAFGHGSHFCLGAQLARMEVRIAVQTLLERNPRLRLAVDPADLRLQRMPFWHRYEAIPIELG
ncbi:MAG: cytochrome P450 [Myxococcota bacterium]